MRDEYGRERTELFLVLLDRQLYPDYYEVIEQPISLQCIQHNIDTGHYKAVDGIVDDMNLMFDNAMRYNMEGSQVYEDAIALRTKVRKQAKLIDKANRKGGQKPVVASIQIEEPGAKLPARKIQAAPDPQPQPLTDAEFLLQSLEKVFAASWSLWHHQLAYDRAAIFKLLPDRQLYPDYYEVIEQPISLQCIQCNIDTGHYKAVDGIVDDMNLMFDNAMRYNMEGSPVYEDAIALRTKVRKQAKLVKKEARTRDSAGGRRDPEALRAAAGEFPVGEASAAGWGATAARAGARRPEGRAAGGGARRVGRGGHATARRHAAAANSGATKCTTCQHVTVPHIWRDGWEGALWEGKCEPCYWPEAEDDGVQDGAARENAQKQPTVIDITLDPDEVVAMPEESFTLFSARHTARRPATRTRSTSRLRGHNITHRPPVRMKSETKAELEQLQAHYCDWAEVPLVVAGEVVTDDAGREQTTERRPLIEKYRRIQEAVEVLSAANNEFSALLLLRRLQHFEKMGAPNGEVAPSVDHILGADYAVTIDIRSDNAIDLVDSDSETTSFNAIDIDNYVMEEWDVLYERTIKSEPDPEYTPITRMDVHAAIKCEPSEAQHEEPSHEATEISANDAMEVQQDSSEAESNSCSSPLSSPHLSLDLAKECPWDPQREVDPPWEDSYEHIDIHSEGSSKRSVSIDHDRPLDGEPRAMTQVAEHELLDEAVIGSHEQESDIPGSLQVAHMPATCPPIQQPTATEPVGARHNAAENATWAVNACGEKAILGNDGITTSKRLGASLSQRAAVGDLPRVPKKRNVDSPIETDQSKPFHKTVFDKADDENFSGKELWPHPVSTHRNFVQRKTKLCWHFTKAGACHNGDDCTFAHGKEQLQTKANGSSVGGGGGLPPQDNKAGGQGSGETRPNDWRCLRCSSKVFEFSTKCFRCHAPRHVGVGGDTQCSIWIGNLQQRVPRSQIIQQLKDYFGKYGELSEVKVLPRQGDSMEHRGHGIVSFVTRESQDQALSEEEHRLDGMRLTVKGATKTAHGGAGAGKVFVGGIGSLNEADIQRHCESFGEVSQMEVMTNSHGRSRGYAFVHYAVHAAALRCLHERFHEVQGQNIEVRYAAAGHAD
jgi:hypothetical protein